MSKKSAIITIILFLIFLIILLLIVFWGIEGDYKSSDATGSQLQTESSGTATTDGIVPITGDTTTPNPNGDNSVTMNYSLDAVLSQASGVVTLYFQNPNSSTQDVSLEIVVFDENKEIVIADSDLIKPGYQLVSIPLDNNSAVFGKGTYIAKYRIFFYDSASGEKLQISSEITDVTLKVTE